MKRSASKSSSSNPEPVERLIDEFARLPGIGRRSAERMAFHILKSAADDALRLARAIEDVKRNVKACSICYSLTDIDPCRICANPNRDASVVLVVEQPRDLISLEQTGMYSGVYHMLAGRLDPLAGVDPSHLTIAALLERVRDPARNSRGIAVREVILGTNPNLEGDSTALYLTEQLAKISGESGGSGATSGEAASGGIKVTRLARGLPSGSQLEYANAAVLADAIQGRQAMG